MPSVSSVSIKQQTETAATKSDAKINDKLKESDSIFDGLMAVADVLAELKQNNPSRVNQFMQNFKSLIKEQGLEALLVLKNIAVDSLAALGLNADTFRVTSRIMSSDITKDIPDGFLWKPRSDNPPYNLVILTPAEWTGNVSKVEVLDPMTNKSLASGVFSGVANEDREHYRFSTAGRNLPDSSLVRILFKNGQHRLIEISDTSARFES